MRFELNLTRPKLFIVKDSRPTHRSSAGLQLINRVDGEDRIYTIRGTKSPLDNLKLRQKEVSKIKSGKHHSEAIGIGGNVLTVPGVWEL